LVHQISDTSSSILLTWSNPKSDKSLQSWGIWQLFQWPFYLVCDWCTTRNIFDNTGGAKMLCLFAPLKPSNFKEFQNRCSSIYLLGLIGCDPRNLLKILKCGGWIMELCMWIPKVQALEKFSKAGSMHVTRHVLDNSKKHTEGLASLDAVTNSSVLPLS
jgi:hypothetical protein